MMKNLYKELVSFFRILQAKHHGNSHKERLDNYYSDQAEYYDDFRPRILPHREALYKSVPVTQNMIWVDMGGGTAANFESIQEKMSLLKEVHIVDLCKPLLQIAEQRAVKNNWKHFSLHEKDSKNTGFADSTVDVVTLSYSLTMTQDWIATLNEAKRILKPGGYIGVVDFYKSLTYHDAKLPEQSFFRKHFIPFWYSFANVWISQDHIPYLKILFKTENLEIKTSRLPGSLVWVDTFIFLGKKDG